MTKRIEWVDIVKGLLILTVVLGHAIQESLIVRGISFENNLWRNIIYSFHMPAFMAMSGFLAYRPNSVGGGSIISLIYKRFCQLIIPFILWSVPFYLICHNVENIWDYILYPNKGYWFLWALFFIIVIFNSVENFSKKRHILHEVCMITVAVILVGVQLILPDPKFLGYEYIAYYFLFYIMGYYANKYKDYFPRKWWIIWSVFVLWAVMACFWTPNELPFFLKGIPFIPSKVLQLGYRILTPIVFLIWMYSAAPYMENRKSWLRRNMIELGQMSLGIYLTHMVIKKLVAQLLYDYIPSLPILTDVVIEFVILTIISVICVRLIKRNNILSRLLLGLQSK